MDVLREVRGHPVEKHADAVLVAMVHEVQEVGGRAVAAGDGVVADGLVAPGAVERVLGDGHQLDVREAHVLDIIHQLVGQLAVGDWNGLVAPSSGRVRFHEPRWTS